MDATGSKLKVDVAPAVLVWARETVGLPIEPAAKKLGIKPRTLEQMESGQRPVTIAKLHKMAKVYDRPLIAFFLPAPPKEAEPVPDFRVVHDSERRAWSPELRKAYRRVLGQREVALELASGEDDPIPIIDLRLDASVDVEVAGAKVRAWLKPPPIRPSDPYTALNAWIGSIEAKGVLVTQLSDVAIDEMRGFSIGEHPLPVIALNGGEPPRGKLFTLMHELAHILLHRGGLCDLDPGDGSGAGPRIEWFCNGVAAAVLMPKEAVLLAVTDVAGGSRSRWPDDDLASLASRFGVSPEAMLVRLVTLRLANRELYRERRPRFLAQYREQRKNSQGFLTYYPEQIRNLGRRYIATVWKAYERGDVSDPDLSTYLQVQLPNVERLVREAGAAQ